MNGTITTRQAQELNTWLSRIQQHARSRPNLHALPRELSEVYAKANTLRSLPVYLVSASAAGLIYPAYTHTLTPSLEATCLPTPTGVIITPDGLGIPRVPVAGTDAPGTLVAITWATTASSSSIPALVSMRFKAPNGKQALTTCELDLAAARPKVCADLECGFCHAAYAASFLIRYLAHQQAPIRATTKPKVRGRSTIHVPRDLTVFEAAA